MDPDVALAIPALEREGVLTAPLAARLLRVARGDLVSLRPELLTFYLVGVMLIMAGVGVLVEENLGRIGPVAIAAALSLAAAAALVTVARVAPAFDRGEVAPPTLWFDPVLILGVLLASADLAFIEAQFHPLGDAWPSHFLLGSLLAGAAALRWDSARVFTLALTGFAAWRGVTVSLAAVRHSLWYGPADALRWNMLGCGILFAALGWLLVRVRLKAHFEPYAAHLGWLLVLGAMLSWLLDDPAGNMGSAALLLAVATAAGLHAAHRRQFPRFAIAVAGAYAGLSVLMVGGVHSDVVVLAWFTLSSIALIFGLIWARARLRDSG